MKSITVSVLVLFTFAVMAHAIGREGSMALPNGGRVVVPTLKTGGFNDSCETALATFRDAFKADGSDCNAGMLWSPGVMTWSIPSEWAIAGSNVSAGAGCTFCRNDQRFELDEEATASVRKFGYVVTRTTNDLITVNGAVVPW